jgi:hypothetical protein
MKFKVSILEYLGRIKDGILVLLNIMYEGESYEATYYYTRYHDILTISSELENKIGCSIEEHEDYLKLMNTVEIKTAPYDEIIDKISDFDHKKVLPRPI